LKQFIVTWDLVLPEGDPMIPQRLEYGEGYAHFWKGCWRGGRSAIDFMAALTAMFPGIPLRLGTHRKDTAREPVFRNWTTFYNNMKLCMLHSQI